MRLYHQRATILAIALAAAAAMLPSLLFLAPACAADWPTYAHDFARSAVTSESLPLELAEAWDYSTPVRPTPAWDEPALWDGWHKIYALKNRQVFDKALHVAVVGDAVFFGSSVDDKVYCLDAKTGRTRWTFYTEGPVRLAPTVSDGRVYVGSDDGRVYCLQADTGQLVWQQRPGPSDRRVPGNGRIISVWAIRTGVVVVDDTAYCCAGVLPSETVYLCALDAATGSVRWKQSLRDLPAEGYMLASPTRLYVTTGRNRPLVFDRATGKRLYQAAGSEGGTYALLLGDALVYGPGQTGQVSLFGPKPKDHLASFAGNHMIVSGPMSYLHTDSDLSVLDRAEYVKVYGQRRTVAGRREELQKRLKKATGEEAAKLKAEIAQASLQIDRLADQLRASVRWKVPCDCPLALILAGKTLVTGGAGKVAMFDVSDGRRLAELSVPGNVYGLAVSGGRLYVSTDRGAIHCFAADGEMVSRSATAAAADAPDQAAQRGDDAARLVLEDEGPAPVEVALAAGAVRHLPNEGVKPMPGIHGPFAEMTAPDELCVTWDTEVPTTTLLEFGQRIDAARRLVRDQPTRRHRVVVAKVRPGTLYKLRIGGQAEGGRQLTSDIYDIDTHLAYLPAQAPLRPSPYGDDDRAARYRAVAKEMLAAAGTRRGYCLVLGSADGQLAYHLARQSELKIVVVDPDPDHVDRARTMLDRAGLYGIRVSVHRAAFDALPYGPYFANLIVADTMLTDAKPPADLATMAHHLRPAGGVIYLHTWAGSAQKQQQARERFRSWSASPIVAAGRSQLIDQDDGLGWVHRRGKLPNAGEWTHQYGAVDNASCSRDERVRGSLTVQWWGRPGPRPMPDRGPRNPPPVSANGRLYVQGNRTLFGIDAYNGTILWTKQIPTLRRANMPRDGSNMVATDARVYVAMGPYCVGFDGQTGHRDVNLRVPQASSSPSSSSASSDDWGYLASVGTALIGSSVRRQSEYLGDAGEWYEGFPKEHIARVASRHLFAIDPGTGKPLWQYRNGAIMNSTLTVGDGYLYFVESRSAAAKSATTDRLFDEIQTEQFLVALDLANGRVAWQQPCDFSKCQYMTYMVYSDQTLLVTGSDKQLEFHTYAYDTGSGTELWQDHAKNLKGHHTGWLDHPVIVAGKVYLNKHTYQLRTGKVLRVHDFNWHGCGIMSASQHTIFRRYEFHAMLDIETLKRTELPGIRSGCWLSLIPSGGLLLAPETSAGCACAHPLQTSIAYVPKVDATPPQEAERP
jgi:outer membrane protein assembly factor BamB